MKTHGPRFSFVFARLKKRMTKSERKKIREKQRKLNKVAKESKGETCFYRLGWLFHRYIHDDTTARRGSIPK